MNFIYFNDQIDKQIKDIKARIRLLMNGVAADQMKASGLIYKQNFGVSILHLKELAKTIEPSHELAMRLWFLGIRETMILATIIEPTEKFEKKTALEWIDKFNHTEIVEITCMNLFSRLPYRKELSIECIKSEQPWTQITGFTLAARCFSDFKNNDIQDIINISFQLIPTENYHLYKSIGLCLSRLVRIGEESKETVLTFIQKYDIEDLSIKYISNEVQQEINFLYG
jgi:3-methyladenine DNA glycosylase AlkD